MKGLFVQVSPPFYRQGQEKPAQLAYSGLANTIRV
jgi:hypothetical protein